MVPFGIHPERSGILPFGVDDNGNEYFWLTEGEPDKWPCVISETRGPGWDRHDCTMTEFFSQALQGQRRAAFWPVDFPSESNRSVFKTWAQLEEEAAAARALAATRRPKTRKKLPMEELQELVAPPAASNVPSNFDWFSVEKELGRFLPEDYKEFVELYGTGLLANFIKVFTPFSSSENYNLIHSMKRINQMLRDVKALAGCCKREIFPTWNDKFLSGCCCSWMVRLFSLLV